MYSGTYTENINVGKELNIISQSGNPEDTVVQALNQENVVFNVTANNVIIRGFKVNCHVMGIYLNGVQHNIISDNEVSGGEWGIVLYDSSDNTLSNNIARAYSFESICLRSSNNNMLINNSAGGSMSIGVGIYVSNNNTLRNNNVSGNDIGIWLASASDNTLSNNNIWRNFERGIILSHSANNNTLDNNNLWSNGIGISLMYFSSNNILSNNNISRGEDVGIELCDSSDNTLTGNTASQYEKFGISLTNSTDNVIYNNYFNNTRNAYDDRNNIWNIAKTPGTNIIGGPFLGGNYWSDYAGVDTDEDGLGDTLLPYNCEGQIASGGDYLPLVTPVGDDDNGDDDDDVKYNPYDANQDCEIDIDELSAAIDDFYAGILDIEEISEIIDYYYLGGAGYC